ncbi:MAG: hypothetical protein ACRDQE_02135 [Gaiellales bacterium]
MRDVAAEAWAEGEKLLGNYDAALAAMRAELGEAGAHAGAPEDEAADSAASETTAAMAAVEAARQPNRERKR